MVKYSIGPWQSSRWALALSQSRGPSVKARGRRTWICGREPHGTARWCSLWVHWVWRQLLPHHCPLQAGVYRPSSLDPWLHRNPRWPSQTHLVCPAWRQLPAWTSVLRSTKKEELVRGGFNCLVTSKVSRTNGLSSWVIRLSSIQKLYGIKMNEDRDSS